jgi:hypothetical protein
MATMPSRPKPPKHEHTTALKAPTNKRVSKENLLC